MALAIFSLSPPVDQRDDPYDDRNHAEEHDSGRHSCSPSEPQRRSDQQNPGDDAGGEQPHGDRFISDELPKQKKSRAEIRQVRDLVRQYRPLAKDSIVPSSLELRRR